MIGTTLHHNYEVRSDSVYFGDIPDLEIGKELLDLASHIIETKKASFDPEKFKDRYQEAVVDLIRSKRAGRPVQVTHLPRPGNVINLMDALRRSLGLREERHAGRKEIHRGRDEAEAWSPRRRPVQIRAKQGPHQKGKLMPASKALEAYRRKRDFSKTIEPSGRTTRETAKPEICVSSCRSMLPAGCIMIFGSNSTAS